MDKLLGRLQTLMFFFLLPLLLATSNYNGWFGNFTINEVRTFWGMFYIVFAIESSILMFIGICALLWKEGDLS